MSLFQKGTFTRDIFDAHKLPVECLVCDAKSVGQRAQTERVLCGNHSHLLAAGVAADSVNKMSVCRDMNVKFRRGDGILHAHPRNVSTSFRLVDITRVPHAKPHYPQTHTINFRTTSPEAKEKSQRVHALNVGGLATEQGVLVYTEKENKNTPGTGGHSSRTARTLSEVATISAVWK